MSGIGPRRDGERPPLGTGSLEDAVKDIKALRGALKATHATATGLATNKGAWDPNIHLNVKATYLKQVEKYRDELRTTGGIKSTGSTTGRAFAIAGVATAIGGLAVAVKTGDWKAAVGSLADLGSVFKDFANHFEKLPGAAKLLAQVGGVSAIVSGLISSASTIADAQKNGWSLDKGLALASSALRVVSGACLTLAPLFPPLAGVAAVAGIASAGLGVASLVAANWDKIAQTAASATGWLKSKGSAALDLYHQAIGGVQAAFVPAGQGP